MKHSTGAVAVATLTAGALGLLGVAPPATVAVSSPTSRSSAAAAAPVTIGSVPATFNFSCSGGGTLVQRASTAAVSYVVPFDGVVTSFSMRANSETNNQVRLMFFGAPTGNSYPVHYRSTWRPTLASTVNQFDVHVPVKAGWLLGARGTSNGCAGPGGAGDSIASFSGDTGVEPALNSVVAFNGYRLNISAVVEPDVDGDGFGDVSEDACQASAFAQAACPAPQTTITKKPKAKSMKRKVNLAFVSSAARSTFLVRVDGKPAREVLSPFRITLKPGKHTITVRAVSPLGVADATPAAVTFKIKKPKGR